MYGKGVQACLKLRGKAQSSCRFRWFMVLLTMIVLPMVVVLSIDCCSRDCVGAPGVPRWLGKADVLLLGIILALSLFPAWQLLLIQCDVTGRVFSRLWRVSWFLLDCFRTLEWVRALGVRSGRPVRMNRILMYSMCILEHWGGHGWRPACSDFVCSLPSPRVAAWWIHQFVFVSAVGQSNCQTLDKHTVCSLEVVTVSADSWHFKIKFRILRKF